MCALSGMRCFGMKQPIGRPHLIYKDVDWFRFQQHKMILIMLLYAPLVSAKYPWYSYPNRFFMAKTSDLLSQFVMTDAETCRNNCADRHPRCNVATYRYKTVCYFISQIHVGSFLSGRNMSNLQRFMLSHECVLDVCSGLAEMTESMK